MRVVNKSREAPPQAQVGGAHSHSPGKPGWPGVPCCPGRPGSPDCPVRPGSPWDPLSPLGPGMSRPGKPGKPFSPFTPGGPEAGKRRGVGRAGGVSGMPWSPCARDFLQKACGCGHVRVGGVELLSSSDSGVGGRRLPRTVPRGSAPCPSSRPLHGPSAAGRLSPGPPVRISLAALCHPPPLSHLTMVIEAEAASRHGLLCATHYSLPLLWKDQTEALILLN